MALKTDLLGLIDQRVISLTRLLVQSPSISTFETPPRIRQGHGAQNMAVLRHMALHLLRREVGHKRGIKARRKRAGWDRDYLFQVLTG